MTRDHASGSKEAQGGSLVVDGRRRVTGEPVRLPVRSAPADDEAPRGWLLRLAELNGLSSPRLITARGRGHGFLEHLPECLGSEPRLNDGHRDESFSRSSFRYGQEIPLRLMRVSPVVCPECIRQRPVARAEWDLLPWTACPTHCCVMIGSCSCGTLLRWDRAGVSRCSDGRCARDLRLVPVEPADRLEASLVMTIGSKLSPVYRCDDVAMSALLADSSVKQVLNTIRLLTHPSRRLNRDFDVLKSNPAAAVRSAARAMSNGPAGLADHLTLCWSSSGAIDPLRAANQLRLSVRAGLIDLSLGAHFCAENLSAFGPDHGARSRADRRRRRDGGGGAGDRRGQRACST